MEEGGVRGRPGKLNIERLKQFTAVNDSPARSPVSPKKKEFKKYEDLNIFKEPMQLIFADETKSIRFNDEVIAELQKVDHDVNVVAVVGLYRTGKSLLLNRLAGVNDAFGIGHTSNAKTMGVWIMCLQHPTQESQVLVLLDTEGLGAVQESATLIFISGRGRLIHLFKWGDYRECELSQLEISYMYAVQSSELGKDRWHFLLASLLASTLVYNHKAVLDADAIQKLTFLKEIKSSLSILESDAEDDSYFDVFFPSFIMVIRDINVKLVDDTNKPISPDQYLETALVLKRGSSDSIREYNLPRQLVRRYFKNRKCFKFAPPRSPNELDKGILAKNMEFENDVKAFTEHIYKCKPKRMTSGKTLNGRMFGSLVRSYVRFIQDRKPPCMHTAVKEMIDYENQNLVLAAQNVYKAEMQRLMGDVLPDTETIAQFHVQSTDKAIEYLRKVIIYDDVELFTGSAMEAFEQVLDRLLKSITKDSERMCWGRVRYLDERRIKTKIDNKAYQHVSGYDEYIRDIEWIIKQYKKTVGLGPKKRQVLQSYLDGKEEEEHNVFLMVQEAQKDTTMQQAKPSGDVIGKSFLRQLSKEVDIESSSSFKNAIKEDLSKQRNALNENLKNIGNEKNKEYERQVKEGFENAPVTEQENKRFVDIFLTTEESEPDTATGTTNDEGKQPVYDPPWTSHTEMAREAATRAPDFSQLRREPKDTFQNWQDDPTYYDFVDYPPGRRPPQSHGKSKPCKIL